MKPGIYSFSIILFIFIVIASAQSFESEIRTQATQQTTRSERSVENVKAPTSVDLLLESMNPRERIAQLFFAPVYGRYIA
ncbi:MAG: hypothetical protein VW868_02195, partial [Bacteroidota bacterium]